VAAIAEADVEGAIRVPDSLSALQHLASEAREEWPGDVVGVTSGVEVGQKQDPKRSVEAGYTA